MRIGRAVPFAVAVLAFCAGASVRADEDPSPSPSPSPSTEGDAARIAGRRLKLGLYGRPTPPQTALQLPRFQSSVDVVAPRPGDPNETMAVFWRQWNLSTGSIYGKGINVNRGCATCVDILPLVKKVVDTIKGH